MRVYSREYRTRPDKRALAQAYRKAYMAVPEHKQRKALQQIEYRKTRPHRKARHLHLKHKYGLTLAQYAVLSDQQHGLCAVCLCPETSTDPFTGQPRPLAVDHNHDTGAIRGLLCARCNTFIGLAQDDVSRLAAAITYLQTHAPSLTPLVSVS